MKISLLDSARTNEAHTVEITPQDLLSYLAPETFDAETCPARAVKDGPCWSPIVWRPADDEEETGTRAAANAVSVCALVYDLDWDETPHLYEALEAKLAALGWRYGMHETYTPGRARLVIPFAEPLEGFLLLQYAHIWDVGAARLGIAETADSTGKDLARVSYIPARPLLTDERATSQGGDHWVDWRELKNSVAESRSNSKTFESETVAPVIPETAQSIDLGNFRAEASRLSGDARKQALQLLDFTLYIRKGSRENTLHQLVSLLVAACPSARDWAVVETVFRAAIERMEDVQDLGVEEYVEKVHSSWVRALEHVERKESQSVAFGKFLKTHAVASNERSAGPEQPEVEDPEWETRLIGSRDKNGLLLGVKGLSSNIDLILRNHQDFRGYIRYNELYRRMEISGGPLAAFDGSYDVALMQWLEKSEFAIETDKSTCGSTLLHHSRRFPFNPVRDYLQGLQWDGKHRISEVLLKHCGAVGNENYIRNISRKFFISCAARALEPGCKVDTVLVLQGQQGTRKTSFVETLAKGWYTTSTGSVADKDMRVQTTESWLVELGELASMGKQSIETLRGFLTQRSDRIRIPYATYHEEFPRRCVFVGTTNSATPLTDEEGNRRWWVVTVEGINIRGLAAEVDQLWAEAVWCYEQYRQEAAQGLHEREMEFRWWFDSEEQALSDEENEMFLVENTILIDLQTWVRKCVDEKVMPAPMTLTDIAKKALRVTSDQLHRDGSILPRVARGLKLLGFRKTRRKQGTGHVYVYGMQPEKVDEVVADIMKEAEESKKA